MLQKDAQKKLKADIERNRDRIIELVRSLDAAKMNEVPAPGKWSVGQVLEHLVRMNELGQDNTRRLVGEARQDAGAAFREWSPSFIGGKVAESLNGVKPLKSAKAGIPGTPRGGVLEQFLNQDSGIQAMIDSSSSVEWKAIKMKIPIMPWLPLRLNLGDAFNLHEVHTRRHIGQIERTLAAIRR